MREVTCADGARWTVLMVAESGGKAEYRERWEGDAMHVLLRCSTCEGEEQHVTIRAPAAEWETMDAAELCRLIAEGKG